MLLLGCYIPVSLKQLRLVLSLWWLFGCSDTLFISNYNLFHLREKSTTTTSVCFDWFGINSSFLITIAMLWCDYFTFFWMEIRPPCCLWFINSTEHKNSKFSTYVKFIVMTCLGKLLVFQFTKVVDKTIVWYENACLSVTLAVCRLITKLWFLCYGLTKKCLGIYIDWSTGVTSFQFINLQHAKFEHSWIAKPLLRCSWWPYTISSVVTVLSKWYLKLPVIFTYGRFWGCDIRSHKKTFGALLIDLFVGVWLSLTWSSLSKIKCIWF